MTLRRCVMNIVHAWHWDSVLWKRKTTLACLVFELSALDLVPYRKPCGAITPKPYGIYLWNFTCMHDIETICHEQGRQLLLIWFMNYLPLTKFHIVNRVWAITPKPYGIYLWKFTDACMTITYVTFFLNGIFLWTLFLVDINSHTEWQTVQIPVSWLLRSQLIWIYTVCKFRVYLGSAGQELRENNCWLV